MGISSNQARFLSLTARQVDLEHRVQQICQRRLRLSSELERVATEYNNNIGNRKMFTYNTTNGGISQLAIGSATTGLGIQGLKDANGNNYQLLTNMAGTTNFSNLKFTSGTGFNTAVTAANIAAFNTAMGTSYADNAAAAAAGWTLAAGVYSYTNAAQMTSQALGLSSTATEAEALEAAIRHGVITISTVADEFSQSTVGFNGGSYELKDWRTLPDIADELYKGDDLGAENKYDQTVTEINSQDKKLQLEQASVEVEYKAISSEREAVKKILDTNASTSFKYFS